MKKEEIIEAIKNVTPIKGRNSMGAGENWYNSYYSIGQCFTGEELSKMSEKELKNLIKLGDMLSEAFY